MRTLILVLGLLLLASCAPGRTVPPGQVAYDTPENLERLKRVVEPIAIANIDLCRDSNVGVITLPNGREACGLGIGIIQRPEINAYTDGRTLYVTSAMMAFIRTDEELATIIGHELGHILRRDVEHTQVGYIIGSMIDGAANGRGANTQGAFANLGRIVFNKDRERGADYWGAAVMTKAGFDPHHAANFWARMATINPGSSGWLASHPPSMERAQTLQRIADEMRVKWVKGEPITIPD